MALHDYRYYKTSTPAYPYTVHAAAFNAPSNWWVQLYLFFGIVSPQGPGQEYALSFYEHAHQDTVYSHPTYTGLMTMDPVVHSSPWVGEADALVSTVVTIQNVRMSGEAFNFPAWAAALWPRPRISDLLSVIMGQGMAVTADILLRPSNLGQDTYRMPFMVNARVDAVLSYNNEQVTLSLVEDRRWEDLIPRHLIEDKSLVASAKTAQPIGVHYGFWGSPIEPDSFGTEGYFTHGSNSVVPSFGGFCSPLPVHYLGDRLDIFGSTGPVVYLARYFDAVGRYRFSPSVYESLYLDCGGQLARFDEGDIDAIDDSTDDRTPTIPPEFATLAKIDQLSEATLRIFPSGVGSTSFLSLDPFNNCKDGIAETWVEERLLAAGGSDSITVYFQSASSFGLLSGLSLIVEFTADEVGGTGNLTTLTVAHALQYGPATGQLDTDSEGFAGNDIGYPNVARYEKNITTRIEPATNNFASWDFTYGDGGDKTPAALTITFTSDGSAPAVNVKVRAIYLCVRFQPFLDLIDAEVLLADEIPAVPGKGGPHTGIESYYAAQLNKRVRVVREPGRRFFIDSQGHRDDPDGRYTGFSPDTPIHNPCEMVAHFLEKSGGTAGGVLGTPDVEWGTGRLHDLAWLRDYYDQILADWFTPGDTKYRCHWAPGAVDRNNILGVCMQFLREHLIILERQEGVLGVGPATKAPNIGAWSPVPTQIDKYDGLGASLYRDDWQELAAYVNPSEILSAEVYLTPIDEVINDLTVRFAYDEASGRYLRSMGVSSYDYQAPDLPADADEIPDHGVNWYIGDYLQCVWSIGKYGQNMQRTIDLRTVYRWQEAAMMRHFLIQLYHRQRVRVRLELHPTAADLAVNGKVFVMHQDFGPRFELAYPDGWLFGENYAERLDYDWSGTSFGPETMLWRVVEHELRPGIAPRVVVVAEQYRVPPV